MNVKFASCLLMLLACGFSVPDLRAASSTPAELEERCIHRHAVEAAIWGMPAVNYELMFHEMVQKTKGGPNQILYWSGLLDWKNQTLTPNPDTIYLMPFFNTKDVGPVVLEIPPAEGGKFNGSVMNYWQAAIEDIGPGGVDKGKGGKYLILPPGFDVKKVPEGYIPMASDTYAGYALIRSMIASGGEADVAKAVAYGKRLRLYPLSQAANPPETIFVDAQGTLFDSTIPYDLRFFESLDRIVQAEPWLERDKLMIDQLKTIGIERGKPFAPDERSKRVLAEAILETKALLDARYETFPPYYTTGQHWVFPVTEDVHSSIMNFWQAPDSYPVAGRSIIYTLAFFSAKHIGESQYYLLNGKDQAGNPLEGKRTYRLQVPANAPVKDYWSVTVYDRETHAFVRNMSRMGRSSLSSGLQKNADGSVDLFIGPLAPIGHESNWIPTDPNRRFEFLARFYGPLKPLFDKSWQLNDPVEVR